VKSAGLINVVTSWYKSQNSIVLAELLDLYLPPPCRIADVTYGTGAFWRPMPKDTMFMDPYGVHWLHPQYREIYPSDLFSIPNNHTDFRKLPYKDEYMDGLIIDPPYAGTGSHGENGKKKSASGCIDGFGNDKLGSRYVDDIIRLYCEGINEAYRVVKPKGFIFVKCQDQIESGKQRLVHNDLSTLLTLLGWNIENLIVVETENTPMMRHDYQLHARTSHSYFLIARKRR